MTGPLRLMQVGLGKWGHDWARAVVPQVPGVLPVAYVDRDPGSLARAAEIGASAVPTFASLGAALRAVSADAVLITTRVEAHAELVAAALSAGKHVLVEKPFVETVAEAKRLVRAAREADRILMVSQQFRHYPAVRKAAELVRGGSLGRLAAVHVDFRRLMLFAADDPRRQLYGVRHALLASQNHPFDLMRAVIGAEPERVYCRTWQPPGSPFTDSASAAVTIGFAGGVVATYRGSMFSAGSETTYSGLWRMELEHGEVVWCSHADAAERTLEGESVVVRSRDAVERPAALDGMRLFGRAASLDEFARAVAAGRLPAGASSAEDNVGTLAMVNAAIASAASGLPVDIAEVLAAAGS